MRIALSTGGGDAPGLNAVIRAVVLSAVNRGWEVLGVKKGSFLPDPDGFRGCAKCVSISRSLVLSGGQRGYFRVGYMKVTPCAITI